MTLKMHLFFWSSLLLVFLGFVWVFGDVLMPFVLGFAIAYLLNPLLIKMDRWGVKRKLAVLLILTVFLLFITALVAVIMPVLAKEAIEFIDALPEYVSQIWAWIQPYSLMLQEKIGADDIEQIRAGAQSYLTGALGAGKNVLSGLVNGGQALASFTITLIFTPIVAYFVMKEWVAITNWLEDMMPEHSRDTIKGLLKEIDSKIAGFIRGQLSVCAVLGLFYAIALSVAGLKYGFFIGLMAGVLSIVPMVGTIIGFVVSVMVALIQVYDPVTMSVDWQLVGIVIAIFIIGQILEGNVLTPKLIGDSVGLHPLWVMFALLAGGALFGILGMLIAVPVAAIAGVLISFAIIKYKSSCYYKSNKIPKDKSKNTVKLDKKNK